MASGVNKVILIGNLGRDPELSYTPSGLAVTRLSLATTENRKNQNGEWEPKTEWHRVTLFGSRAETASQYLNTGSRVYIEGKITYGTYEKDGITRYSTDIIAYQFINLTPRSESDQSQQQDRPQQPQQQRPPQQQQQRQQQPPPQQDYKDEPPYTGDEDSIPEEDLPF